MFWDYETPLVQSCWILYLFALLILELRPVSGTDIKTEVFFYFYLYFCWASRKNYRKDPQDFIAVHVLFEDSEPDDISEDDDSDANTNFVIPSDHNTDTENYTGYHQSFLTSALASQNRNNSI